MSLISMPNRYQLTFLASFVLTFACLYIVSEYISAALKSAGYDISQLILIGLPKTNMTSGEPLAVHGQNFATSDFLSRMQQSGYMQIAALLLAALSSLIMYVKFAGVNSGACSAPTWSLLIHLIQ
jgi:cytochrome-b5 reductase